MSILAAIITVWVVSTAAIGLILVFGVEEDLYDHR